MLYLNRRYVLQQVRQREIPAVTVIGGGYCGTDQYEALGMRHTIITRAAYDTLNDPPHAANPTAAK